MAPGTRDINCLYRPPRNPLSSKWNLLFDKDCKEWIAFKPALGLHVYPCYSCRHMFYSKRSFQDHINRRAVMFTYRCPSCEGQSLVFYNRCSLLLHCRKHYSFDRGEINLNDLEVASLPIGLAGFCKLTEIPYLFDVEEEYLNETTFMNAQFYAPKNEDQGKAIITLTPSHLVINRTDANGESQALALKQIAKNIPKCQFITLQALREIRMHVQTDEEVDAHVEVKIEPEEPVQEPSYPEIPSQELQSNNHLETSPIQINQPSAEQVETTVPNDTEITPQKDLEDLILPVITKIETVEDRSSPEITEESSPELVKVVHCPECNESLVDTLGEHFLGNNRPLEENLRCGTCRLICPTSCSFKAHARIHEKLPPYVCPDCGEEFQSEKSFVQHMEEVCFHLAKSVRYRCPGRRCGKLFASESTFGPHFRSLHIETYFKCSFCEDLFSTLEICQDHSVVHDQEAQIQKIFSCYSCGGIEMTAHELKKHINMHCKDLNRCMYIYMCKFCKCYFRSIHTMATHLQNCKVQKTGIPRQRNRPTNSNKSFTASKYTSGDCKLCNTRIIFTKNQPKSFCNKCVTKVTPKKPVSVDKCVCVLCKKQIGFEQRKQHHKECQYAKPLVYVDKIDVSKIDDYVQTHNLSVSSSNSDLDGSHDGSHKHKSDSSDDNRPKKKYKPNRSKRIEMEDDLTAEEPIPFDGTYMCRLCNFQSQTRETFQDHVKIHRHISTAYQCMDCGECFVVKPSLIKHLMHFHNVVDTEQYFRENNCFDEGAVKELAKVVKAPYLANNVKENQCKVCMEQFKSQEEHDKHFRSHGMAFLMTKSI